MLTRNSRSSLACLVATIAIAPAARAQWAVIDAPAIAQLIQEVQTMQQQLTVARNQLQSAQQALQSMTGGRGMTGLLAGTIRNYLPANWTQLTNALQGSGAGGYAGLAADMQSMITANAVLSPQRLAALAPADQQQIQASRQWSAMQQALTHEALANASGRFASVQSLISAISTAADQKAILDLQARISAELGMLQNEQTKNQVLFQATQAQESAIRQQALERAIEGQGNFATRFQPVP
ncbi:MAG TPA: type IV secretion system protein [Steroidobacteraceae bacterium]|nr:type IV secretion system protein [Steroidobacteraceae bacterium]